MGISRKRFLQALAAVAAMGIPHPKRALAAEGDDTVLFDSELALDYAERFVKNNYTATAGVDNPIPIVDVYGQPAGYAVDVLEGGANSGYVLLDVNCPDLITSFCFDKGTVGPYERHMQGLRKSRGIKSVGTPCLMQLSPLDLYPYDEEAGKAVEGDGSVVKPLQKSASTPTTEWTNLMIGLNEVYGSPYTTVSSGYIGDYWFATEEQIERNTGLYACAITALYTIAGMTWTGSGFLIDPFSDWSCYRQLWNYTKTTTLEARGAYGGTLGSTTNGDIGPGFASFCSSRGYPQNYSRTGSPQFSTYKKQVDERKHSVFSASITKPNGEESGHSMAVQGWACLKRGDLAMNTLSVYDGWASMTYLNVSYSGYGFTYGTFF